MEFLLEHLWEILFGSGGIAVVLMSVLEVSKIQVNPWSWIARTLGNALNAGVMKEIKDTKSELKDIRTEQEETRKRLDSHIAKGEEQTADNWRSRILRFNNELVRKLGHTQEDYDEILEIIDRYEAYCKLHPGYKNNKCLHAIANIGRVYDDLLKTNGFLES